MKQRIHTARILTAVGIVVSLAAAPILMGCEDGSTPPVVVPQPLPGPPLPQTTMPQNPNAAVPQYGVVDPAPAGAPAMNAQAAAFYQQGWTSWGNGDLAPARTFFSQAVEADPEAYQAFYSLGVVEERLGKASALTNYKKAFTVQPEYDRAIVAYGMYQAARGNLSEADTFLTSQRAKRPKSAAVTAALAEVKSLQKDTASAQELAQQSLKLDATHAPAMLTIARDHYRNRRLDLALYALQAVLDGFGEDNPARDPTNAEAHLLRAFIWAEQDNRPGAIEAFRKTLELRPDLVVARLRLATYLLESGGADEALPMLQKALKYDSDNIAGHLSLGDAYRLTGQFAKAKAEFEWVRKRDSSLPQVHYNFGLLYLFAPKIPGMSEKQQVSAAIAAFNKYKEMRPKAEGSDVDGLLNRANLKKAEIDALEAANAPQPPPPPPPPPAPADGAGGGAADG